MIMSTQLWLQNNDRKLFLSIFVGLFQRVTQESGPESIIFKSSKNLGLRKFWSVPDFLCQFKKEFIILQGEMIKDKN